MNKEDMKAYKSRWAAVNEFQRLETQQMTDADRWREFRAILSFARIVVFQLTPRDVETDGEGWERWQKLRSNYLRQQAEKQADNEKGNTK